MNEHPILLALLDLAAATVQFAANWFLQSAVLITIGLAMGRLLARRGSAAQSAVYRTTLVAVLICPLASWLLSLTGVSGWSVPVPPAWTEATAVVALVADPAPVSDTAAVELPTVAGAALTARLPESPEWPEQGNVAVEIPPSPAVELARADVPEGVADQPPIQATAIRRLELPTFSIHAFACVAVGICVAWFLIAAGSFARLGLGWWRMARLRDDAVPADGVTGQICHALAKELGIVTPEVLRSPGLPSPCLAGIRRPVVLLPAADLGLSVHDVLVHELAHLARRDCHWNLVRLATLSACFFQPLLWILSRRLEMTAEEVCDDYVVQFGGDRFEYAYRLVDIAELCTASMALASVGIVSLRSMLARRVQRIMDPARPLSTRVGSFLLTLVVAGGLVGTAIVGLVGIDPRPSIADVAPVTTDGQPSDEQPAVADKAAPATDVGATAAKLSAGPSAPAEKLAGAPPSDVISTVSFQRDSAQFAPYAFDIWALAFSADDRFLASSGGGGWNDQSPGLAHIWDFDQAKEVASYPTAHGSTSVALSADGRRLATCSWGGEIWMREVGGAELLRDKLNAHARVAFSPDGTLLVAVTERGELRTWNGLTGTPIDNEMGAFRGDTFPFFWVGFSPDGKYLVVAGGKEKEAEGVKFAVYSVATRQQLYEQKAALDRIHSAAISPDSQTLATGGENAVALWDLATGVRRSQTESNEGLVYHVEFSPDGKLLASTNYDNGIVTLWDPSTGKALAKLTGHDKRVRALAFTHDSQTLVTGGQDRTLRVWDVATRQQMRMLQGAKSAPASGGAPTAIVAVAYSPDGSSLATASDDGQVNIYGISADGISRSWVAHADAAAALAWSPDGNMLATGGFDKLVKFWNPATGQLVRTLSGHTGWVNSLAFSHDGQTLASGSYDRSIRLWNVADGLERQKLAGHTATIRSLAFSHNDKLLASGSTDQTVKVWDAASGAQQSSLAGHQGAVRSVAFSANDRLLASGSEDQTIRVWNVDARELRGTLSGHTDMVSAVAFVGQTLVSTSWDHTLRTWETDALKQLANLTVGNSEVVAMTVAPDSRHLLCACADQSLTLWKVKVIEGQRGGPLGQYHAKPWTSAFSPDGSGVAVATGGIDQGSSEVSELYLYDVATKAEKGRVVFPGSIRSIAFAPAGDLIALGFAKKRLLLVDAATGSEVAQLEAQPADAPPAPTFRYTRVAFSLDGKLLASSSYDDDIRIYDVERRTLVKTLKGHQDRVLAFVFSPDQTQLLSCSAGKSAIVWDLENSEKRSALTMPGNVGVASVSYSPDGKLAATGSSNDICCLWQAETGNLLHTLRAHDGIVFESIFSPDGKTLATSGEDGLVKLWEVTTGKLLRTYECHSGSALSLRFSPDGKSFVTTGKDGDAKLWSVLPPETS